MATDFSFTSDATCTHSVSNSFTSTFVTECSNKVELSSYCIPVSGGLRICGKFSNLEDGWSASTLGEPRIDQVCKCGIMIVSTDGDEVRDDGAG